MAVKAGFSNVFACDDSHVMYSIALKALPSNQMDDKVTLFHLHSTDLSAADLLISTNQSEADLPISADLSEADLPISADQSEADLLISTDLSEADLLISAGKGDGGKTVDVVVTETVDCGT